MPRTTSYNRKEEKRSNSRILTWPSSLLSCAAKNFRKNRTPTQHQVSQRLDRQRTECLTMMWSSLVQLQHETLCSKTRLVEQGTAWSLRQWHKHIQWTGRRWGSDSVCDFQSSLIEDIFRHASNMTTIKCMIITMHKWSDEALSASADFWQVLVAFLSGTNNCCCPGHGHVHSPAWPDGDIWVQAASFSFDCFGSSHCEHNFCFHCVTATKTVS